MLFSTCHLLMRNSAALACQKLQYMEFFEAVGICALCRTIIWAPQMQSLLWSGTTHCSNPLYPLRDFNR